MAGLAAIADVRLRCQKQYMNIKIIGRPIGEAPEWVRDSWIGVSLPLARGQPRSWIGLGVLSGPTNAILQYWMLARGKGVKVDGYLVNANVAVDRLAEVRPEAAAWWREHTPTLLNGRRNFVFNGDVCQAEET